MLKILCIIIYSISIQHYLYIMFLHCSSVITPCITVKIVVNIISVKPGGLKQQCSDKNLLSYSKISSNTQDNIELSAVIRLVYITCMYIVDWSSQT